MTLKILIADDHQLFRKGLISLINQNSDYEVISEASNGRIAVRLAKKLSPDIVIMDVNMPELNGIEAVKEIIQVDPKAVIIMCSAMGQQAMVIEAIAAGAKDFVIKPFQPPRVLEAVERALAK